MVHKNRFHLMKLARPIDQLMPVLAIEEESLNSERCRQHVHENKQIQISNEKTTTIISNADYGSIWYERKVDNIGKQGSCVRLRI